MYDEQNDRQNDNGQNEVQGQQESRGSSLYSADASGQGSGREDGHHQSGNYYNPYSSAYGSNPMPGNDENGKGRRKRKGGKMSGGARAALALAVAAVFGLCAGAGAVGVQSLAVISAGPSTEKASPETPQENAEAPAENGGSVSAEDGGSAGASEEKASGGVTLKTSSTGGSGGAGTVTDVSDIAEAVMPSIVSVYNSAIVTQQDLFGQVYTSEEESAGSGIIIAETDTELLIATNNHVVSNANELKVQFIDNSTAEANIKGTNSGNDLAVLAVKRSDIPEDTRAQITVATIGDSDELRVGEPAIAIGNALGYGQSVTTGVISAVDRELPLSDTETNVFIQTDAAINPGNSGGALLNSRGEVIGINSNKIGATKVEGMGYAIPMSRAIPIIEELMNRETREKVSEDEQGYLGISGISVTAQVASAYNMPEGVYVAEIMSGTGAADSGLQKGDIITKIGGVSVSGMDELKEQLAYYKAGTKVTLTIQRADNGSYGEREITLKLSGSKEVNRASAGSGSGSQESGGAAPGEEENPGEGSGGSRSPFGYFFDGDVFGNGSN
ncbi:S1C family serine protease [Lachnoclostridium sp. Marseille-P6806]|uniref:S1C family serine protease n=1 Tax=Lachnoclostridium sp. Marseille-P6806 TaxID=2364793 RepID=UPI001F5F6F23|nr:trypsin-like peptidase domain-containing protein [Lachnoclostridium sp. Marseille-P6806]